MARTRPIADNVIRDDFTTEMIQGGRYNDHLIHHRDPSVEGHDGTGLSSFNGDDILEGSVPDGGQIHMFAGKGDDWFVLDVTKDPDAIGMQGHHVYGGHGQDTFQFTNIEENLSPIVGRLDDFDPTSDQILIEDTEIDLTDLPRNVTLPGGGSVEVRVIEIEHPEFIDEDLGSQYFLAIGEDIFYALDGARDLQNGTSGMTGEERHFLRPPALETLRSAETVQYENPKNFVPREFYEDREDELNLDWYPDGHEVFADTGDKTAAHMFGGKGNMHAHSATGGQVMHGSDGDDVIDANTGNDTVNGGQGDDLIAGGIDFDDLRGGSGDDMIWGGDGDDSVEGDSGNDHLEGGRGDDVVSGGEGNDTIVGGRGDDTLEGGGGEDAINRFHFYEEGGHDTILDFKVDLDLITLQDDIDPLTVELFENKDGNTVMNYGETGSVELSGVSLEAFQEAAEIRAEEEDPIITITPDPEEEMLQGVRAESGFYDDEEPPSLMVEGLQYGATPFQEPSPGGYTYVTEDEIDEGSEAPDHDDDPDDKDEDEHQHNHEEDDEAYHMLPMVPVNDEEQETEEEDPEAELATCFVATAAYGDHGHPDVVFLRAFRDHWLVHRAWGRAFIAFYWRVGPKMARPVRRSPRLAGASKALISGIVRILRKVWV
ncbi:calcium-binding protein [Maritimibacter sp. HL-12]|uniref:calcium-binding protein n=1 Tax=Maritimibacter sp. HL-12 TaxID=1162418 RepID=UPI000A0F3818|nr:calcium-binding protein [Maritimibacter sp. HL-12]SMH37801.1 Hemolysin-type calcium-binding repeat-containing protein [Maritimibacter sp. HL-12]